MLFDLAAWAVILLVVSTVGHGVLAVLPIDGVRLGDRLIIATWIGVVILAATLLAVSLATALTPAVSASTAATLTALGAAVSWRAHRSRSMRLPAPAAFTPRWSIAIGVVALLVGAAALASDPVTLYDSLVYHVGIIRWLREVGTVPGVALIHNRLGQVSAWFTLGAGFDAGPFANRAANVPFGVALVVVGVQISLACARIASSRAAVSDWFLMFTSGALIWAAVAHDTATPSPDVPTNILILVAAWTLLVIPATESRARLVPFVIAIGACAMKLFALPAVAATGLYYVLASPGDAPRRTYVRRMAICLVIAVVLIGPTVAANVVASGCPAYPSPIGCIDAPWSVGVARAAEYAEYVRDVARWERRGVTSVGASFGWVVPWMLAHSVVTALVLTTVILAVVFIRRSRAPMPGRWNASDTVATLVALAILGTAFAAWEAPAPRFFYSSVLILPSLALGVAFDSFMNARKSSLQPSDRQWAAGFVVTALLVGFTYALASQKLNVRSALTAGARLTPIRRSDLVVPSSPEAPARLFRWRVNDVDVLTPVPRPIADTLRYHSVIGINTAFEKCSTAPLPCTPYLPAENLKLRHPASGLGGGFVRIGGQNLAGRVASCVGEFNGTAAARSSLRPVSGSEASGHCGDPPAR